VEVLERWAEDRRAVGDFFFANRSQTSLMTCGQVYLIPTTGDGRLCLSKLNGDRRVIYKPRSGRSESAWFSLLAWMNRNGFQPKLRVARVLLREDYYWMEYVEPASCKNEAAVGRFYQRIGRVDCGCLPLESG